MPLNDFLGHFSYLSVSQGGNNEAAKEAEKHKQLEDNYNLVWEKNNRKSKRP